MPLKFRLHRGPLLGETGGTRVESVLKDIQSRSDQTSTEMSQAIQIIERRSAHSGMLSFRHIPQQETQMTLRKTALALVLLVAGAAMQAAQSPAGIVWTFDRLENIGG